MKIAITGASGFVGRHLLEHFSTKEGSSALGIVRNLTSMPVSLREYSTECGDFTAVKDWGRILHDVDVVIHSAARVHVLAEKSESPEQEYFRHNVQMTLDIANACLRNGIRRMVFISTIGVHGNTTDGVPFNEESPFNPITGYARSKLLAEQKLIELVSGTPLIVTIIRPPMIYGRNAPGNYARLLKLVKASLTFPLGGIRNKRHFLAIENLISFLESSLSAENHKAETYIVSDRESISTTKLIQLMADALDKKSFLIPVPSSLLQSILRCINKNKLAEQLTGDLELDISKAKNQLNWEPALSVSEAIKHSVGN